MIHRHFRDRPAGGPPWGSLAAAPSEAADAQASANAAGAATVPPTAAVPAAAGPAAAPDTPLPAPMTGRLRPPDSAQVRAEARADPHRPSPAFVAWSRALGEAVEAAAAEPQLAPPLFAQLSGCVLDQQGDNALVAALCLDELRELALRHPAWRGQFEALAGQAPPAVRRLSTP